MKTINSFLFLLLPFFLVSKNSSKVNHESNLLLKENTDPNRVSWKDSLPLKYTDFKGQVPFGTGWAALTASSINMTYGYDKDSVTSWSVQCYFDKTNSWMKTKTVDVLSHEQLHFEISEIIARMLRKKIRETKTWKPSPHNTMEKYFSEVNKICDELQDGYDNETEHGTIPSKQKEWKLKIDSLLVAYNSFKK